MQEITERLYQRLKDDFYPVAEKLAKDGRSPNEIASVFKIQLDIKTQQYYEKVNKGPKRIGEILGNVLDFTEKQKADSKLERIFYQILIESEMKFEFQYSIGPYRADFLFSGFLVVELDGPQHEKEHDDRRDLYMRKMGYKIVRVPVWILISDPYAVIEEIREAISKNPKK